MAAVVTIKRNRCAGKCQLECHLRLSIWSAIGRLLLYVITGVEVPVLANERLFTRVNFQRDEGLKTAISGPKRLNVSGPIFP